MNPWLNRASLSFFYKHYFGWYSSELAKLIPLSYTYGRTTCHSNTFHNFPRCYKEAYAYNFFHVQLDVANLCIWNVFLWVMIWMGLEWIGTFNLWMLFNRFFYMLFFFIFFFFPWNSTIFCGCFSLSVVNLNKKTINGLK